MIALQETPGLAPSMALGVQGGQCKPKGWKNDHVQVILLSAMGRGVLVLCETPQHQVKSLS